MQELPQGKASDALSEVRPTVFAVLPGQAAVESRQVQRFMTPRRHLSTANPNQGKAISVALYFWELYT
jgi:hypothetical protein